MNLKKIGLFAGGVLFGTAGVSILTSKDAKKIYTGFTAAVLRGKDSVMKTVTAVRENCGDIYEDALDMNEKRYEKDAQLELEKAKAIVAMHEEEANHTEEA